MRGPRYPQTLQVLCPGCDTEFTLIAKTQGEKRRKNFCTPECLAAYKVRKKREGRARQTASLGERMRGRNNLKEVPVVTCSVDRDEDYRRQLRAHYNLPELRM